MRLFVKHAQVCRCLAEGYMEALNLLAPLKLFRTYVAAVVHRKWG